MPIQHIISATQSWLNTFIIAYSICPFAKREQERDSIRYQVIEGQQTEACLLTLMSEIDYLNSHPKTETTLLIFSDGFAEFNAYLDMLELAEQLLVDQCYEGVYQLASFHPDYCFEDSEPQDAANYTNRSPYPMLHIIRESSIETALNNYPNPEAIPERNIALTRELGVEKLKKLLANSR